ncbi:MAG TPA: hypothetical protein VEJ47_00110 [Candidatus Eremiobacteraceae bacterium]|nr:hypothetical protein [Candidatus Eremiobacteraceae bacterium]
MPTNPNRPKYLITRTTILMEQCIEAASKLPDWMKAELAKLGHEEAERIRAKKAKIN